MFYVLWLLIFVGLPTILIWIFNFNLLWKYKKTLIHAMFFALIFSIPWDIHAIQTRIWYFPKDTNLGILIYSIPIEEFLFMTTITLMVASITIVAKYKFNKNIKI